MAFSTPSSVESNLASPTWTREGGGTGAGVYYTDVSAAIPSLQSTSTQRVGLVLVAWESKPVNMTDHASVVWDGVTMTARTGVAGSTGYAQAFYLIGCAHNGTYTIRIRATGSNTVSSGIALVTVAWVDNDSDDIVYDNEDTSSGSSATDAVVDVPISAAGVVFSASGHTANANTSVTGCTVLQEWDSGGNCFYSAYSAPGSATTATHTHIYSQTGNWQAVGLSFISSASNSAPTISPNTSDGTTLSTLPTLEFTGSDTDDDDLRYNIQITDNPDAFTSATQLEDANESGGTSFDIHPNPLGTTAWNGNPQVDDRPGQSFTGNGGILEQIELYFGAHESSPADTDGDAYVRVYAHGGTFGTSSQPAGADTGDGGDNTPTTGWLAISDAFPFSPGSAGQAWRTLTFSGANRIRLRDGTKYMLVLDWVASATTPSTNTLQVNARSSGTHAGNMWIDGDSANYGVRASDDLLFRVYESYTVLDKVSGTDSGFANTVSGGDTDPFNAGEKVSFTVQSGDRLSAGITYYWRARVKDPSGTNTYSDWSSTRSFTTSGFLVAPRRAMAHMLVR